MKWAGGLRQVFKLLSDLQNQVLQSLKVKLKGHKQLKSTGLSLGIKMVPTRGIFTMEQWGKCFVTVRNMENMPLKIVGSEINKIQTETIKNIKVIYYVPTLFSSVVC